MNARFCRPPGSAGLQCTPVADGYERREMQMMPRRQTLFPARKVVYWQLGDYTTHFLI